MTSFGVKKNILARMRHTLSQLRAERQALDTALEQLLAQVETETTS